TDPPRGRIGVSPRDSRGTEIRVDPRCVPPARPARWDHVQYEHPRRPVRTPRPLADPPRPHPGRVQDRRRLRRRRPPLRGRPCPHPIAFVIAALWGGAGIFLYALAWLFLRSAGDEVSPGEALLGRGRASGSKGTALVLVVVVFLSAPTLGGSGATFFVGAGVLMTAAMLAGWYGLHRRTPTPPAGWAEGSARPQQRETAGGTEPAPGPRQDRPRSRLTKVTLGLALIAVAVSVGLATLGSIAWLDATTIAAIALAVVAGGLLIGAITRRGHGLLVVAGPLAGFVLLSSLVDPYLPEGGWENAGELQIAITDPADLSEPVRHEIGGVTVDLRGLELDRDRSYSISNNVGEVRVLLPEDLNVDATCRNDVGRVDCPAGTDTPEPSGPVLTLDVHNRVGTVEVSR